MARTAFIIGGTGMIGIATAAELLRAGWRVTLSHTGKRPAENVPAGAEIVALDRGDTEALRSALGTGADALIDMVAFNGAHGDQLLSLADLTGILAVISSASVYADPQGRSLDTAGETGFPEFAGPIRETAATIEPGTGSYSRAKVELEQHLAGATRPVTILRPCAIHGINAKHPREWWFVKRMLDGRSRVPLAGGGGALFHTTASINLARAIRATIDTPATRVLNCGDPDAPSLLEIGEALASQLDWAGAFVPVPADSPIGQTPWS
ncbi:MAG: NAD-dependent epimerase/dehydratase family protein, partial [Devosia sp.]